jgi:hypothetical protein
MDMHSGGDAIGSFSLVFFMFEMILVSKKSLKGKTEEKRRNMTLK